MLPTCRLRSSPVFLLAFAAALTISAAARPVVASGKQSQDDPDRDSLVGVSEYNAGHYDAAIALFNQTINRHPAFSDSYFNRGLCYEAKKDWQAAISDFDRVLTKRPKLYDAYIERCRCYLGLGDLGKAQDDLNAAIDLKPERLDAYELQGDLRIARNDYDNAVKAYTHYFEVTAADAKAHSTRNSPDPNIYRKRGMANLSAKNYEAAVEDLDQFIAHAPQNIDAYKERGIAEFNLRDYAIAFSDLEKYSEAKPGDDQARKLLAEVSSHIAFELPTKAQRMEHLQKHPDDFRAWHDLGVTYLAAKRYSDALAPLTKAIVLKQDAQYFVERGFSYYNLSATDPKVLEKALADANAALALKPDATDARLLKADAEFGTKGYAAASRDYAAYLALPGISADDRTYAQKQITLAQQAITPIVP